MEKPPREIQEMLVAYGVMRRLGFEPEDIYMGACRRPHCCDVMNARMQHGVNLISCVLQAQGKSWVIHLGATNMAVKEVEDTWNVWCARWVASTDDELDQFGLESPHGFFAFDHHMQIILSLLARGFEVPATPGLLELWQQLTPVERPKALKELFERTKLLEPRSKKVWN